ncbi:Acyl transferase/acyl hydrolase/lysophospholipase [Penicillium citrinum]|uniref:Acyl transferase/acyl hydrolase/lysophospholipase n=1 Tax=Penicillium citrinum TaxID=5077 RepID=A0A9W9TMP4_PENCI|nr:Acyl transferase/acyl hydrolase/lysophospholipase [Penicillium citrinum]KAJ5231952.1 Acyl transferase/acyl hydrolase/lysophospholipase [Penicillium citrinum]
MDDGLLSRWPFDPTFERCMDRTVVSAINERINYKKAIRYAVSDEDTHFLMIEDALQMNVASAISTDIYNIDLEKSITVYSVDSLKKED